MVKQRDRHGSTFLAAAPLRARGVEDADDVTYVVVCDPGDEAFGTLTGWGQVSG
jgi:hypothetical protein